MNFRQISTNINGPKTCEEKISYLLKHLPIVKNDLKFAMVQRQVLMELIFYLKMEIKLILVNMR